MGVRSTKGENKNESRAFPPTREWTRDEPEQVYAYQVDKLSPGQSYVVRLMVQYNSSQLVTIEFQGMAWFYFNLIFRGFFSWQNLFRWGKIQTH